MCREFATDQQYGDIVLGPFIAHFALHHRTRAVRCALLGAHADRMLIGACNPIICAIHVFSRELAEVSEQLDEVGIPVVLRACSTVLYN